MKILNRLKKLQSEIIGNDSEFCACQKEVKFKIITSPEDDIETVDICQICNKPLSEAFRFTFTINPNVQLTENLQ